MSTRRAFVGGALAWSALPSVASGVPFRPYASHTFGVFTLFEPQRLLVSAAATWTLTLDGITQTMRPGFVAEIARSGDSMLVRAEGAERGARRVGAAPVDGAELTLEVPVSAVHGGIRRSFRGPLEVLCDGRVLTPVVTLDEATAVASIIAAESPAGAALAYLEAQAIVSRSFLAAARPGHTGFQFCDTTHCQFLRAAPGPASPEARAVARTEGLRLRYAGEVFAALYSRGCGGRTRLPGAAGVAAAGKYPYFAVDCAWCRAHRLPREGHGVGLCQRGAAAMARAGVPAVGILARYYPGAVVAMRGEV